MEVERSSNINDAFSASAIIGEKLLRGWTLLNDSCHICKVTPLVKQKNKEERFCAQCNLYIKEEKSENDEESESSTPLENNKMNNEQYDERKVEDTIPNQESNNIFANSNIKYIKEIKLQNEEFNEILNKNNITKNEIKNLFEYKNYIKERCGYDVGTWLKTDNKHVDEKKEDEQFDNTNSYIKETNFDKTSNRNMSDSDINKYKQLENELLILNKTKSTLIKKLEKYSQILTNTNIKNEEFEYTNQIKNVVEILEKINNLKKNAII
ncbi:conserved Plasmodium protein, unknown function [Plasmodium vinckei vinckei]|uniref:Uncharacterized protein n=1 Tax=Plasmodium vinckei vinckei TaxID=54757 RepID=A0A449BW02_PLAVN|nr:conserved Plasmodium protein, unknown function [Plasmodium vinckei vinckei]KEG03366.1 hypothetical protein YYE_01390 [Plasmodium vinckei vinckei]VEV57657.1 conserved Plasmodium protein, unknown function [Plasmodium vinckei vinckei]